MNEFNVAVEGTKDLYDLSERERKLQVAFYTLRLKKKKEKKKLTLFRNKWDHIRLQYYSFSPFNR